jgi:hypothetical protein
VFIRVQGRVGVLWCRVAAEEGGKVKEEGAERVFEEKLGICGRGGVINVTEPEEAGDRKTTDKGAVRAIEKGGSSVPSEGVGGGDGWSVGERRAVRGAMRGIGESNLEGEIACWEDVEVR